MKILDDKLYISGILEKNASEESRNAILLKGAGGEVWLRIPLDNGTAPYQFGAGFLRNLQERLEAETNTQRQIDIIKEELSNGLYDSVAEVSVDGFDEIKFVDMGLPSGKFWARQATGYLPITYGAKRTSINDSECWNADIYDALPTSEDLAELKANCDVAISGDTPETFTITFTSRINGNRISFPMLDRLVYDVGSEGWAHDLSSRFDILSKSVCDYAGNRPGSVEEVVSNRDEQGNFNRVITATCTPSSENVSLGIVRANYDIGDDELPRTDSYMYRVVFCKEPTISAVLHRTNPRKHITESEREIWNEKQDRMDTITEDDIDEIFNS